MEGASSASLSDPGLLNHSSTLDDLLLTADQHISQPPPLKKSSSLKVLCGSEDKGRLESCRLVTLITDIERAQLKALSKVEEGQFTTNERGL